MTLADTRSTAIPAWNETGLILLQNLAHPVSGHSFWEILRDVLLRLLDDGGVCIAWRTEGRLHGFVANPIGDGRDKSGADWENLATIELSPPEGGLLPGSTIDVVPYTDAHQRSGLYFRSREPQAELWLLCPSRTLNHNPLLDDARVREGFFAAVRRMQALLAIGAARHRELDQQADGLELIHSRDSRGRLPLLRALLGRLPNEPSDCLDIAARLGRQLLNEYVDRAEPEPTLEHEEACLRDVYQRWANGPAKGTLAAKRVLCTIHCLSALRGVPCGDLSAIDFDETIMLFPLWVRLHALWSTPQRGVEAEWEEAVQKTVPKLGNWLVDDSLRRNRQTDQPEPMRDLPSVRNSLSLWLCLQLLHLQRQDRDLLKDNALRVAIAYELRESLRFIYFGDRCENMTHLCRMVVAHAQISAPYCDFSALLRAISRERGCNHYAANEHLRHVLDIYIAGHYVLELQLAHEDGQVESVANVLFTKELAQQGRAAFGVAALFHDIDLLFLPDRSQVGTRLLSLLSGGESGELRQDYRDTATAVDGFVGGTIGAEGEKTAIKELKEFLDPPGESSRRPSARKAGAERADDPLRKWLGARSGAGTQHGVLSAWFLLRQCRDACDASQVHSVLGPAVRAVLLHDTPNLAIDLGRDPVAGLLVLCNEVFVWDPKQMSPEPADRWINPASVRLHWDEPSQRVIGQLNAKAGTGWPVVQIALRPELPVRVWQICVRKARNLGRLLPASTSGFCPVVEVISAIPPALRGGPERRTTRWLLREELLHRLPSLEGKTALREWLDRMPTQSCDSAQMGEDEEVMILSALPAPRPELERINLALLNKLQDEWEASVRQRPAPSPRLLEIPPAPGGVKVDGLLREELQSSLPSASDFDAFCVDHFPATRKLFAVDMDRQRQITLLLEHEDHTLVRTRLRTWVERQLAADPQAGERSP